MKMRIKIRKRTLRSLVCVIVLVMFTDTLWIRFARLNRFWLVIGIGAAALAAGLHRCTGKALRALVLLTLPAALSMAVNVDFNTLILFKIALLVVSWTLVCKADLSSLIDCFISFMVWIALFSLVCMALRPMIVSMDVIPVIDSGSYGTKALVFSNVKIGTGNLYFLRNQGPFWEPGAYQAYLNTALMFLMFGEGKRKHSRLELVILCGTVISTVSTAGYLVLGLLMTAKMAARDHTSTRGRVLIAGALIALAALAVNNETVNYLLFDKLNGLSEHSISGATRLYSVVQNVRGILQNPVFGIGPTKYAGLFLASDSPLGRVSAGVNTTTSLSVWALYGVLYFILFNLGLVFLAKSVGTSTGPSVLICLAAFVIYNTENWNYSLFFNFLAVLGYLKKGGVLLEGSGHHDGIQQKREDRAGHNRPADRAGRL